MHLFCLLWSIPWASTFLDVKFAAAMQQPFNPLCLQVQVLQAWKIWGTPFLHLTVPQLVLRKSCGLRIWHHAKFFCQNGWHRHASLWFLCDVTSMCRIFERSRKQVTFILAWEAGQIDQGFTASAALCNTSFGQEKSGIRWTNRHSIVHDWL